MKEQSDQSLHCLPLCLHILWIREQSDHSLHCLQFCLHILWMREQSDQCLHCLPFCLHILWMREQSDQRLHCLQFGLHILWMKEQSDQGLHRLPFHVHLLDEGWSYRVYTVYHSVASFGWRSSLIRVYTVCNSICIFWMHSSMTKCSNFVRITEFFFKSECSEFLWKVIVSQCLYPLNYGGSIFLIWVTNCSFPFINILKLPFNKHFAMIASPKNLGVHFFSYFLWYLTEYTLQICFWWTQCNSKSCKVYPTT